MARLSASEWRSWLQEGSAIADRLARCLADLRAPDQVRHTLAAEMIRFHTLLIAAGYPDALCATNRSVCRHLTPAPSAAPLNDLGQRRQADSLVLRSPGLPKGRPSFLKLLVENGKATDHGAVPVPWASLSFARHRPTGPLEETRMS
jgi:hypothetical protein